MLKKYFSNNKIILLVRDNFKISNGVNMSRGVALLFTLLIAVVTLSVSLGVFNLIIGEISLSGTTRDSQLAFYASDAGVECALYWDIQQGAFSTSTASVINCAGQTESVGGATISNFSLSFGNGSCVDVSVEKLPSQTIVTSQGKNTCEDRPRTVQRGLQVSY